MATRVAIRNGVFSHDFAIHGHAYSFKSHGHDDDTEKLSPPLLYPGNCFRSENIGMEDNKPANAIFGRKTENSSDIDDILHECGPIQHAETEGILDWIKDIY